jgi:hypothetical protein
MITDLQDNQTNSTGAQRTTSHVSTRASSMQVTQQRHELLRHTANRA